MRLEQQAPAAYTLSPAATPARRPPTPQRPRRASAARVSAWGRRLQLRPLPRLPRDPFWSPLLPLPPLFALTLTLALRQRLLLPAMEANE